MVTLEEYNTKCATEMKYWRMWGVNDEWRKKVGNFARRINEAIMEEFGITDKKEIGKMPGNTPLGEKADLIYEDFVKLLDSPFSTRINLSWDSL